MGKTYQCPKCDGTEITWDRRIGKAVCPNDETPVNNYKTRKCKSHSRIKKNR